MRIAFLCGSLEPGRDGVGDYTRLLAGACVQQGHECIAIALHDRHVKCVAEVIPMADLEAIPTLQLPATLSWSERSRHAREQIDRFNPDWVSLQFVCYGFNSKGFVHGLASELLPLVTGRRLHFMFHELWIGAHAGATLKDQLVGIVQRHLILGLIRQLHPAAVTTSTTAYITILGQNGIAASLLPIFGNIPVIHDPNESWLFSACSDARLSVTRANRTDFLVLGLFGALHPGWPPEPLFTSLRTWAAFENKRLIIVAIGRLGGGERLWSDLARTYDQEIGFIMLGEQSAERVSDFLHWIDCGIATSPWELIGKSGSVASMLDHGLPVIVNRDEVRFRGVTAAEVKDPLLVKMDSELPARISALRKRSARARLPEVTQEFLRLLRHASRSAE